MGAANRWKTKYKQVPVSPLPVVTCGSTRLPGSECLRAFERTSTHHGPAGHRLAELTREQGAITLADYLNLSGLELEDVYTSRYCGRTCESVPNRQRQSRPYEGCYGGLWQDVACR